jgi:uncharacterized protein (TIGR03067 family)
MSKGLLFLATALSLGFAPTLLPKPDKPKLPNDCDQIQGKWRVTKAMYGDRKSEGSETVWTITRTHFVYESGRKATYSIDPKKKPREIDCVCQRPDETTEKLIGVYELKGDELTICLTDSDKPRPKKCEQGRDCNFFILKRVNEKK